jgi:pyruvate dehydrogenase E1 component beta subunit
MRVIALSPRHDPAALLRRVVLEDDGPTVFVENKLLYPLRPASNAPLDLVPTNLDDTCPDFPPLCYQPDDGEASDVTLVTYGGMTIASESAMKRMVEQEELRFDYFVLTQLWPQRLEHVVESARRTGRLVVVEENVADFGIGAAVISAVAQRVGSLACRAVGSAPVPIPAVRHLEDQVLPSIDRITAAIQEVI